MIPRNVDFLCGPKDDSGTLFRNPCLIFLLYRIFASPFPEMTCVTGRDEMPHECLICVPFREHLNST